MRKPYQDYRQSGVPWLGDVPAHWEVRRLKDLCSSHGQYGANVPATQYQDTGVRFLRTTDITAEGYLTKQGVYLQPPAVAEYILNGGDILLSRSGTVGRSFIYQCAAHGPCAFAGYLVRFVPKTYQLARYIHLFTKTAAFEGFLQTAAITTTIENVNAEKYANCHIPLPPIGEQRAIADFLNRETVRIEQLVAKHQLLIKRLAEYREAVITRAVTKGLPPDAEHAAGLDLDTCLKPSGIKWIGDIPRNWTTVPLKYVATYSTSTVDKKAQDNEIKVRLCNYTDVYYQDRINAEGEYMEATASSNEHTRFKLLAGDTVITKDSEDWRDIAVPALVEKTASDFVCGYHLGIIRPGPRVNPTFMFWAVKSTATNRQMQVASSGVTRYGLPNPAAKSAVIAIPPADEQRAIADYLDQKTARIDALTERAGTAIERLNEYRTALINAAVTGKIDVREPGAAEEPTE